jgi:glutamate dehydrogenase
MAGGDGERNRLIGLARRALGGGPEAARLKELAGDLYDRVSLEDLAVYEAADLAAFVRAADALLARRRPGTTNIVVNDPVPADSGTPGASVTVVGIVNDDMPFLLDSTLGELQAFGAALRLVAHPVLAVSRDAEGHLITCHGTGKAPAGAIRESLIHIHVARLSGAARREALAERLASLFVEVRRAVTDWPAMLARLRALIADFRDKPPPIAEEERAEAIAFLEWLAEGDFTFLGVRDYDFAGGARRGMLRRSEVPGLGILADPSVRVLRRGGEGVITTPAIREFLLRPDPLIVTKSNLVSRVHRRAYADYIGVKRYGPRGGLAGEARLIGLFTSTAYTRSVRAIPYLRRKVAKVIARAGFDPASHSGKALLNVLETYPRDELFQIDEETLFDFALAILALDERPRIRVLARRDRFDRFVSVLVYVPRDRYDSAIRARIGDYLAAAFDGHVSAFYPAFPEGSLARVHFIIGRRGGATPDPGQAALEAAVEEIVTDWEDDLAAALRRTVAGAEGDRLASLWRGAFPAGYREAIAPDAAVADIAAIEALTAERPIAGALRRRPGAAPQAVTLKLSHLGGPITLSVRVPILEDMGLRVIDEQAWEVKPVDGRIVFVHDMDLERSDGRPFDLGGAAGLVLDAFMAVWFGKAESDGYNALTVNAGIPWRDVALIRALSRYIRQTGASLTQHYMAATLARHAAIAAALIGLFYARFDPDAVDEEAAGRRIAAIEAALDKVESLDEDRIIRRFLNIIEATVRTNFFQRDAANEPHPEIVLKLDAGRVEELPAPRPFREIFLYSPRVEGLHLRFGPVARGGIRWSDRPIDFRTEILGLVKAQQAKNAVIVPVGAKGGFVPKRLPPPGDRAAVAEEGRAAYSIFIARLLDITDNRDGDRVVPPARVVRRDGDDPYLVVAADKGTANFSDTANAIAEAHGFWLGDAFASGGSQGYDHKRMGITARGAWEAVKRHFREMDIDIDTTPFTTVGVGDMSGDVFGNAMLLSPVTKLVAAFDHRDIFLDPDPDPAVAIEERRRLFALPRSSWQDYDRAKISRGGGVFSRREKSVPLSPEVKRLLELPADRASPNEVLRAILKARVDLLFFGGIGTFVRGSEESDERVGDRTNDAIRITGLEVRAKVVGEGANLGMTQRARIEYSLAGGRCNSDAIDNSAGVNTSDLEVNIKIALGRALKAGRLDLARRNRLLVAMTGEVAALVLRNNYLQTLAISLSRLRGFDYFGFQRRLMQDLERRGLLDRKVEALPDDIGLAERQVSRQPLTRPELGVLMAFAKIAIKQDLVAGGVADDPMLDDELFRYFPSRMRDSYAEDIAAHPLRAEIVATAIANAMVNGGGPTFVLRVADRTGAGPVDIARAFFAAREVFGIAGLDAAIDALDNRIAGGEQLGLYRAVQDLLVTRTVWFLRNVSFEPGLGPVIEAYRRTVIALAGMLARVLSPHQAQAIGEGAERLAAAGVPEVLAAQIAGLPALAAATDIHIVAESTRAPLEAAARIYFAAADDFRVARIGRLAQTLPVADYYDGLARDRALETLATAHRGLAIEVIRAGGIEAWLATRGRSATTILETVAAAAEGEAITLSRLTVAASLLADLLAARAS